MCDDIEKTLANLTARGVDISQPPSDAGWGLLASIKLPGGSDLSIYQPHHPIAYDPLRSIPPWKSISLREQTIREEQSTTTAISLTNGEKD